MPRRISVLGLASALLHLAAPVSSACTANTTSTSGLQDLIQQGGEGYTLSLCAGQVYSLDNILNYTAADQEISTEGYPRDSSRATLLITGFNQSTAVQATNGSLDGTMLRNIQINGNRGNEDIYTSPGANIEFGGDNSNQLVEYVKTYDPRGWSCLHVAEGPFRCQNVTLQYNDIGPCGSERFQEWADGISLSCQGSLVQGNDIVDATDGGIVIFGAPYSHIRNNTIYVKTRTLLGGINMVDPVPWKPEGNFSGVVVENNRISGGFATSVGNDTFGPQNASAIIKIGIAIGPRTWFSDGRYGTNQSIGAVVQNNQFSGAFSYAIGMAGVREFTIQNNSLVGNVSFIGSYGPNCTTDALTPHPPVPWLIEPSTVDDLTISVPDSPANIAALYPDSSAFINGTGNGLTCLLPPSWDQSAWPYGGEGVNASPTTSGGATAATSSPASSTPGAASSRAEICTSWGIMVGITTLGFLTGGLLV